MRNYRARNSKAKKIPPPPGPETGYDEIIAYHSEYTLDELERAGYSEALSRDEAEEFAASATYYLLCRDGLRLQLPRKHYELLSALAAEKDVPAEKLVKRWIMERLRQEARQLAAGRTQLPTLARK